MQNHLRRSVYRNLQVFLQRGVQIGICTLIKPTHIHTYYELVSPDVWQYLRNLKTYYNYFLQLLFTFKITTIVTKSWLRRLVRRGITTASPETRLNRCLRRGVQPPSVRFPFPPPLSDSPFLSFVGTLPKAWRLFSAVRHISNGIPSP